MRSRFCVIQAQHVMFDCAHYTETLSGLAVISKCGQLEPRHASAAGEAERGRADPQTFPPAIKSPELKSHQGSAINSEWGTRAGSLRPAPPAKFRPRRMSNVDWRDAHDSRCQAVHAFSTPSLARSQTPCFRSFSLSLGKST